MRASGAGLCSGQRRLAGNTCPLPWEGEVEKYNFHSGKSQRTRCATVITTKSKGNLAVPSLNSGWFGLLRGHVQAKEQTGFPFSGGGTVPPKGPATSTLAQSRAAPSSLADSACKCLPWICKQLNCWVFT